SSDFPITRNPAVAASARKRLDSFARLVEAKRVDAVVGEEGRRYLSRMPRLAGRQEGRKLYQGLADGRFGGKECLRKRAEGLARMKLGRGESDQFARTVHLAILQVEDLHVKEFNRTEVVGWAIRGLFGSLEEELPRALEEGLAGGKKLSLAE